MIVDAWLAILTSEILLLREATPAVGSAPLRACAECATRMRAKGGKAGETAMEEQREVRGEQIYILGLKKKQLEIYRPACQIRP